MGVLRLKYEVALLKKELQATEQDIKKYGDDFRIYLAEWGCLNNPERLKTLCDKHLSDMKPMEKDQMISYKKLTESEARVNTDYRDAFKKFLNESLEQ
jgi:hypothetical protein